MKIDVYLVMLMMITSATLRSTDGMAQEKPTAQQLKVQTVVRTLFEGFSLASAEKFNEALTADAKILETGVIYTMDSLMAFIKNPRPADFQRVNTFDFFQTEVTKEMAFVSYYNTADFHANNKARSVKWLESAVLVKDGPTWKIKMLHSTRLPAPKQ